MLHISPRTQENINSWSAPQRSILRDAKGTSQSRFKLPQPERCVKLYDTVEVSYAAIIEASCFNTQSCTSRLILAMCNDRSLFTRIDLETIPPIGYSLRSDLAGPCTD